MSKDGVMTKGAGSGRGLAKIAVWVAILVVVFFMPQLVSGNQYWLTVLCLLAINVLVVSSLRSMTLINEI